MTDPAFIATDRGMMVAFSELIAIKSGELSRAMPTDRFGSEYAAHGLLEPLYNMEVLMALIEMNTWHARCCSLKANDVAGLGSGFTAEEGAEPNPDVVSFFEDQTRHGRPVSAILVDAETDYQITGCLAIEVVREGYDPARPPRLMAHVPVHTLRVHTSGNKFCQIRGTTRRWFKKFGYKFDVDMNNGWEHPLGSLPEEIRANEIIWDKAFCGRSDHYGMPQIIPALGAIEGMRCSRNYNLSFFKNYGIPSYAIYISGDYNLGAPLRIKLEADGSGTLGEPYNSGNPHHTRGNFEFKIISTVKDHLLRVAENPHAPMILAVPGQSAESRVQVEIKPLSVEMKEGAFRLLRKEDRDEVLTAHGVPGYRIGLMETGSLGGSTAVESTRIYRDSVVNPRKEALAALINMFIIQMGFEDHSTEFYFAPLDLAEEDHEKDVADFLFRNGAMTPNELRRAFGDGFDLGAVENATALDSYYLGGQMIHSPTPERASIVTLNGAQVASLLQVVAAVSAGTLAADAAALIIERAFSIPKAEAVQMVGETDIVEAVKGFQQGVMEVARGNR